MKIMTVMYGYLSSNFKTAILSCLIGVDDVCGDRPGGSGTSSAVGKGAGEFQSGSTIVIIVSVHVCFLKI